MAGKWKNAVLVGLVASLLGAADGADWDVNINFDAGDEKKLEKVVDMEATVCYINKAVAKTSAKNLDK